MDQITSHFFPVINGTITPSTKLQPVLDHQFTTTPLWKQGIIAGDVKEDEAYKQYTSVADFSLIIQKIEEGHQSGIYEDAHLYELLSSNRPVRPYLDLEWDAMQLPDILDVLSRVIEAMMISLQSAGVHTCHGISIFYASGECSRRKIPSGKKASFHVLFDTVEVFRSTVHQKAFIQQFLMPALKSITELRWFDEKGIPQGVVDPIPYMKHQTFRMPFQSKFTTNEKARPLIPFMDHPWPISWVYTAGIYEDPSTLSYIEIDQNPIAHARLKGTDFTLLTRGLESIEFPKVVALCNFLTPEFICGYETARNLIWLLWAVEQTERMRSHIHSVCSRGANYDYAWVEGILRGFRYSGFTIGSLIRWAQGENGERKNEVEKIMETFLQSYDQELFHTGMKPVQSITIHQRYLGQIGFESGSDTLLIQSHLGTGKTVSITNLIRLEQYKRILIISPRKSYTYSQLGQFANDRSGLLPPLESYLDHTGPLADFPYLIVQVESLHRVGEWFQPYDLVIMDESESILNQLHSIMTHGDNLINNHQVMELIMRTAGKVILADAFMTDRSFHFVKELRGVDRVRYLENTYQPYEREAIQLVGAEENRADLPVFCERILKALRAGKRIVVLWTSKQVGEDFVKDYLLRDPATKEAVWRFYHSDTSKEDQLGLRDVEETWSKVQCVMMTTSITVGISYDPRIEEVEFDEAFLYGTSATALPRDIAQALLRVRVLKSNRLTYVTNLSTYAVEECGFTNVCNLLATKETHLHPLAKWTLCPPWAKWNYVWNENERRCSCTYYRNVLERYLSMSGYTLTKEECHLNDIVVEREWTAEEEVDDEYSVSSAWDDIANITREDAEAIKRTLLRGGKADIDPRQQLEYKKWLFRSQFVKDCDEDIMKGRWEHFLNDADSFWNVVMERRWSLEEMIQMEAKKRYAIMTSGRIKKRETMERFLGLMGMKHSQEKVEIDGDVLEQLGVVLEKEEMELREGLGLRASRRKDGTWKITHTIDLIKVMMEEWCGGGVETIAKSTKKGGHYKRSYNIILNNNSKFWNHINISNADNDTFLIKI
jgi:hypothetical protein